MTSYHARLVQYHHQVSGGKNILVNGYSATDEPDVIAVFKQLQAASRDHHLPAFRRSLARETNQQPMRTVRGRGRRQAGRNRGGGYGNRRGGGCRFR